MNDTLVKLRAVSRVYRAADVETAALSDVNLEIKAGEFIAVMGPSGCGKSTLLNIVGMLDLPSSGQYLYGGEDLSRCSEARLARARRGNVGFVFQSFNLIEELTVAKNIELALMYQRVGASDRKQRVEAVMDTMAIAHRAKHFPSALSGGQQQRVAIARAVIADPKMIVADEPTGNLDSQHGDKIMRLLQGLNDAGTTVVMVTHSSRDAAYARRTIQLFDGRVVTENLRVA